MNIELLKKIAAHARLRPKTITMSNWVRRISETPETPCGTAGCIAGWALLLEGRDLLEPIELVRIGNDIHPADGDGGWSGPARTLLKLTATQAERLFYESGWPGDLLDELLEAGVRGEPEGEIVARRIERFIDTEGWA